jgi:hypothetical protein
LRKRLAKSAHGRPRLGSSQTRHAGARLISATNADLKTEIAAGHGARAASGADGARVAPRALRHDDQRRRRGYELPLATSRSKHWCCAVWSLA